MPKPMYKMKAFGFGGPMIMMSKMGGVKSLGKSKKKVSTNQN